MVCKYIYIGKVLEAGFTGERMLPSASNKKFNIKFIMIHNFQKRWVFTWNADESDQLVNHQNLEKLLNKIAKERVFQLEKGKKKARRHYQGRFKFLTRKSKRALLQIFSEISEMSNLTLQVEIAYDSSSYCEKIETRIAGPWYAGLAGYLSEKQSMTLNLKKWQNQVLSLITGRYQSYFLGRKVIWVQDSLGGQGKSTFIRYS